MDQPNISPGDLARQVEEGSVRNEAGLSAAWLHVLEGNGLPFYELQLIRNADGRSAAACMVEQGMMFSEDSPALFLKEPDGESIAHKVAKKGHPFTDPKILALQNSIGETVQDYMNKYGEHP